MFSLPGWSVTASTDGPQLLVFLLSLSVPQDLWYAPASPVAAVVGLTLGSIHASQAFQQLTTSLAQSRYKYQIVKKDQKGCGVEVSEEEHVQPHLAKAVHFRHVDALGFLVKYPLHGPYQQIDRLLFTQITLHFKSPREVLMEGSLNNRWRKPYPAISGKLQTELLGCCHPPGF